MKYLITGVSGFIGANTTEYLLSQGHRVIGIDLSLDCQYYKFYNHDKFTFFHGNICDGLGRMKYTCTGVDAILHLAAFGGVPKSFMEPNASFRNNVDGFNEIFEFARTNHIKRVVFASSSSVYGDNNDTYKREEVLGKPLSPYAYSKTVNELQAKMYQECFGIEFIGLRYFNVWGRKQCGSMENGPVIARWIELCKANRDCQLTATYSTSRDFTYIDNVVSANALALETKSDAAINRIYNIACGDSYTLEQLFELIKEASSSTSKLKRADFRKGDIVNSRANISLAKKHLKYKVLYNLKDGLKDYFDVSKGNNQ